MMEPSYEKHFIFIESVIFVSFVVLDLKGTYSSYVKYLGVVVCFVFELLNKQGIKAVAMFFTLMADLFLLVLNKHYIVGVLLFVVAQIIYHIFLGNKSNYKNACVLSVSISLVGLVVLKLTSDITLLSFLAIFYFSNLLSNVYLSKEKNKALFFGFVLFVCCDICVGFHNLLPNNFIFMFLIWVFYLPSQVLIALG